WWCGGVVFGGSKRRGGRVRHRRDEPLDRLVQPLVIECAAHGRELVAKFFGRRRRDVGVVRALVLPDFNHREVVRPIALLEHVEAHGTRFLAAVRHQGLERRNTLVLLRRRIAPRPFFTAGVPAISMPVWTRSSIALMRYGLILSRNSLL